MSWCPQCGYDADLDEEGCCAGCGCDAIGNGVVEAHNYRARALRAEEALLRMIAAMGAAENSPIYAEARAAAHDGFSVLVDIGKYVWVDEARGIARPKV